VIGVGMLFAVFSVRPIDLFFYEGGPSFEQATVTEFSSTRSRRFSLRRACGFALRDVCLELILHLLEGFRKNSNMSLGSFTEEVLVRQPPETQAMIRLLLAER
jgi:hypothetical protein